MSAGTAPPPPSQQPLPQSGFSWIHDPRPEDRVDHKRAFLGAVALHVILLGLTVLSMWIFPSKSTLFLPTLRVDVVGLPDILKKDLKRVQPAPAQVTPAEPPKAPEPPPQKEKAPEAQPETITKAIKTPDKIEVSKDDEMALNPKRQVEDHSKVKRDQKIHSALARIRALDKLREPPPETPTAPGVLIKGNIVSPGKSLSSDAKEALQSNYYDEIRDRIQEYWSLPVWLARQNLSARVQIRIDQRGHLSGLRFLKPSGNPTFDEAVAKAIQTSQPFPLPPADIRSQTLVDGIIIGFPL